MKLRFVFLAGRTRVVPSTNYPLSVPCPKGYRPLWVFEFPRAGDLTYYETEPPWEEVDLETVWAVERALEEGDKNWSWVYEMWLTKTVRKL